VKCDFCQNPKWWHGRIYTIWVSSTTTQLLWYNYYYCVWYVLLGNKNLPNLLETDEPPTSSSSVMESSTNSTRRVLSAMNDVSIGGRHLVGEVQMWWANCLHDDDQWDVSVLQLHIHERYLHIWMSKLNTLHLDFSVPQPRCIYMKDICIFSWANYKQLSVFLHCYCSISAHNLIYFFFNFCIYSRFGIAHVAICKGAIENFDVIYNL